MASQGSSSALCAQDTSSASGASDVSLEQRKSGCEASRQARKARKARRQARAARRQAHAARRQAHEQDVALGVLFMLETIVCIMFRAATKTLPNLTSVEALFNTTASVQQSCVTDVVTPFQTDMDPYNTVFCEVFYLNGKTPPANQFTNTFDWAIFEFVQFCWTPRLEYAQGVLNDIQLNTRVHRIIRKILRTIRADQHVAYQSARAVRELYKFIVCGSSIALNIEQIMSMTRTLKAVVNDLVTAKAALASVST